MRSYLEDKDVASMLYDRCAALGVALGIGVALRQVRRVRGSVRDRGSSTTSAPRGLTGLTTGFINLLTLTTLTGPTI